MGRVYRARDLRLNRTVALKVLAPALADQREALVRLRREAETASSLNHPALVTIFDVGESSDGQVFVAMELIEGMSLREALREKHPPAQILDALAQVADGLAAAHASGVIHRDIKPENLMIGSHGYAKVVDFGLAKPARTAHFTHDSPTIVMTGEGMIVGTIAYMAPEQLRGDALDGACDVFSLGCVIHEALSGRAPFAARTQAETIARILHGEPAPLPADEDPRLAALVRTMLARDAAERPSMRAVAQELRAIARGSGAATTVPRPRPRRTAIAVLLAVVAAAAAILLVPRGRTGPASTDPSRPADPHVAELYARAQFFAGDPKWIVKDQSIPILEEVVRRDPAFLPARAKLAQQYARRAFASDPDRQWEQKAFLEADRILRIDSRSADAHAILAQLKWTRARNFPHEEAMLEIARALAAEPAHLHARSLRAGILMHTGLLEEALADYQWLRRRQPADRELEMRIARIQLWLGDAATALRGFREYTPDNYQVAIALLTLGRDDEAATFVRQHSASAKEFNYDLAGAQAIILARQGRRAEAELVIAEVIAKGRESSHFHHALYSLACAYAAMGDAAKAVEALENTARLGMPCHPLFEKDPLLDPIRKDARFQRFLADSRDAHEARRRMLLPLIASR